MKIFQKIIDFVFPDDIRCVFCDEDLHIKNRYSTCESCMRKLVFNNANKCIKCGKPLTKNTCPNCLHTRHFFKYARAPLAYEGVLRREIHNFKYNKMASLSKSFAEYMYDEYLNFNVKFDAVIAVPLHEKRYKNRGYNQSYELLKQLNTKLQLEDLSQCVVRSKDTLPQAEFNRDEREENLKNAFKVVDARIKGKVILLIDDVVTTTATVNAVSRELLKHGAKEIYVLSLAHG